MPTTGTEKPQDDLALLRRLLVEVVLLVCIAVAITLAAIPVSCQNAAG